MIVNNDTIIHENMINEGVEFCQTSKELIISKSMYILMERFVNIIVKENAEYDVFLNKYFNDERYIDLWRIPILLLDLNNGNAQAHATLLDNSGFANTLIKFLGDFYNYCIEKRGILAIDTNALSEYHKIQFMLRKNQCLYNLILDTYSRIIDNISSYRKL